MATEASVVLGLTFRTCPKGPEADASGPFACGVPCRRGILATSAAAATVQHVDNIVGSGQRRPMTGGAREGGGNAGSDEAGRRGKAPRTRSVIR